MRTKIAVILDRSGSMSGMESDVIGAFNKLLDDQKKIPDPCQMSVVRFDHEYEMFVRDQNLADIKPLDSQAYQPRGNTALLDAIGRTIDDLGRSFDALAPDAKPEKVIVVIHTDGEENASKEYSADRIKTMIEHQTSKYGWSFIFVGANQDAILAAKKYGIQASNAMTYANTSKGVQNTMRAVSCNVSSARLGRDVSFSAADRDAAMAGAAPVVP